MQIQIYTNSTVCKNSGSRIHTSYFTQPSQLPKQKPPMLTRTQVQYQFSKKALLTQALQETSSLRKFHREIDLLACKKCSDVPLRKGIKDPKVKGLCQKRQRLKESDWRNDVSNRPLAWLLSAQQHPMGDTASRTINNQYDKSQKSVAQNNQ